MGWKSALQLSDWKWLIRRQFFAKRAAWENFVGKDWGSWKLPRSSGVDALENRPTLIRQWVVG